jgi:hypothetical protein
MNGLKYILGALGFSALPLLASQLGPHFPTHHFPTDRSFHLGYKLGYFQSGDNFNDAGAVASLAGNSSISRLQQQIIPEYQPSRVLNVGAYLHFDGTAVKDSQGNSDAKNAFGDQIFFTEYRLYDVAGASIGLAFLAKFPLYSNVTSSSLNASGARSTVLLGDAQSDYTVLATSEFWPQKIFRTRLDFGYTYRSDDYSAEIPYMLAFAFVTKKLDLEFRLKGNFSQDNDKLNPNDPSSKATQQVQNAFAGSKFALSGNPTLHLFETAAEFWFHPLWSAQGSFAMPYRGKNAPKFWETRIGVTYRWVERDQEVKRTVKEVDIKTDQERGRFEGEDNDEFIQ